jgi:hypothetical protein
MALGVEKSDRPGTMALADDADIDAVRGTFISQIEIEDGLVAQRMGWMLQFNGFLIASYGLALKEGSDVAPISNFLASIPLIGLAVSILSLLGIWAAESAAYSKRREWRQWMNRRRPAGEGHNAGRPLFLSNNLAWYASTANGFGLPAVVTGFWLWMLLSTECLSCS